MEKNREDEFVNKMLPNLRRSCFEELKAYTPGEQPQDIEQWTKLNTNENPYPPPEEVQDQLCKAVRERIRMYPDPTALELRKAIVENYLKRFTFKTLDSIENVTVANGSDETLDLLFKTFIDKGDHVLYCSPSYGMYPVLAESYDATKVVIPLEEDFTIPMKALKFRKSDKLLIICSPNNPNGGVVPLSNLEKICSDFPGIVFVDEAYGDFAEQTALEILPDHPNLIVGKTFSKSFSMASIRLGFSVAHKEVAKLFNTIRLPYNVSHLTQIAGKTAMQHWDKIQENVEKIVKERKRVSQQLKGLGFTVLPSQSNFLLIKFANAQRCKLVFEKLKERKILARYWSSDLLNKYLRITIGTPAQNELFLENITQIANE